MYDLANQSFQLLINTQLFSLFVQKVVVGDPAQGDRVWSRMVAGSVIIVILLSPVMGAIADRKAWKRELLLGTGVICAILTASLAILQPGQIALAAALYITAAVLCGLGENFLGSFLPEISKPSNVGYVSALGWTMSYVGALLLLGVVALFAFVLGRETMTEVRPMFVIAGVWFLLGISPAVLYLRERAVGTPGGVGSAIASAFARLGRSALETRKFRQLALFLSIFLVYSVGTKTVIYFMGIIGNDLGFGLRSLVLFALLIAVTAGLSASATARWQDRIGHRRTVIAFLALWVGATLAVAGCHYFALPVWCVWVASGAIGLGLGGIGTASRAIVGAFTPEARAGEFFGLWGMVDKLAVIIGVLGFGAIKGAFQDRVVGQAAGLVAVAACFGAGMLLMLLVDEREGVAQAQRAGAANVGESRGS